MIDSQKSPLLKARKAARLSMAALGALAGTSQQQIERLEKGGRKMTKEWAERLAPHLGVAPESLIFGVAADAPPVLKQAPVRGLAAAGLWMEYDDLSGDAFEPIPIVPTKYTQAEQFAYKIAGPSMDKERIFDGDYVVCVPYWEARTAIQSRDTVVIERRDGAKIERTCKQVEVVNGGFDLCPRSTDPRFQKPIHIPNARSPNADDGLEVEIVGLVIGVYSPR